MFGINVDIKTYPWAVRRALEEVEPKSLKEAGRLTMRVARGFIRNYGNPDKSSQPGKPPNSHRYTTRNGKKNNGFKRTIVYALRPDKKAVWIGPQAVIGGLTNFAPTHEFGGVRKVIKGDPNLLNGVKKGDLAPVNVINFNIAFDKVVRVDPHRDPKNGKKVFWIKIRTKDQAEHSSRLYYRMCLAYNGYGNTRYPARPFMKPSLLAVLPKLPFFWKGVVQKH